MKTSRRQFAAALAATPLAAQNVGAQNPPPQTPPAQAPPQPQQRRGTQPEIPPFQAPIEFTRAAAATKVRPFPMTQVRLLAGPFDQAREWNQGYMSRLPVDRLVRNFRVNAGLPTGAKPFGGWEKPNPSDKNLANQPLDRGSELRGHFTGHFLSASAHLHASTGDLTAKAKGDEIVDELAKCQAKLAGG
ncbi:MAG TPA: beta-L-arabinofuranosidase domain-containing protein, partial [Bryobacteraceae bacterium]|nr:beta-L-arabinofuranosidase domain-containing protein [Bryobacteraceae bacterium]